MKNVREVLILRAAEFVHSKRSCFASAAQVERLARRLNDPYFDPLLEIYREIPICDALFHFCVDDAARPTPPGRSFMEDYDPETEHALIWMPPEHILFEIEETVAGPSAFAAGFLPIGHCAMGSGDVYFMRFRGASDLDAPLYQVYYDWISPGSPTAVPSDALKLISHSLSKLLAVAEIITT